MFFICFIYEKLSSWIIFQLPVSPFFSRLIVSLLSYTASIKSSMTNCTFFGSTSIKNIDSYFLYLFPRCVLIIIKSQMSLLDICKYHLVFLYDFFCILQIINKIDKYYTYYKNCFTDFFLLSGMFCQFELELPWYLRLAKLDSLRLNSRTVSCIVESSAHILIPLISTDVFGINFSKYL